MRAADPAYADWLTGRSEIWSQAGKDALLDKAPNALQHVGDWEGSLRAWNQSLIERYIEGQLALYLHLAFAAGDSDPRSGDYCVLFQSAASVDTHAESLCPGDSEVNRCEHWQYEVRLPVFVEVGKLTQRSQPASVRALSSVIRLQRLDLTLGVTGGSSDLIKAALPVEPSTFRYTPPVSGPVKDREGRRFLDVLGETPEIRDRQIEREVVEAGAKIVKAVPDQNAKGIRWLFDVMRSNGEAPCLRVVFASESIDIALLEPLDRLFKLVEVRFGPVEP